MQKVAPLQIVCLRVRLLLNIFQSIVKTSWKNFQKFLVRIYFSI